MTLEELDKLTRERVTVSVNDTGRALSLSRNVVYAAVNSGDIPSLRIGRCIRVKSAALRKMVGLPPVGGAI